MEPDKLLDQITSMKAEAEEVVATLVGMEAVIAFARDYGLNLAHDDTGAWTGRLRALRDQLSRLMYHVNRLIF